MFKFLKRLFGKRNRTPLQPCELWLAALRSGQYRQTQGALTRVKPTSMFPVGHCCLGVLCQVYQQRVGDLVVTERGNELLYDGQAGLLPEKVQRWAGLRTNNGKFTSDGVFDKSLVSLNDSDQKTFAEIADVVESEPEGLFA